WPTRPMTPITCAKPSPPRGRSPSSPTTRHARSNIHSTSISMPSAISWNAASQNSSSSAASQPDSKRPPEITAPSSLSRQSSCGCDKCPHHLVLGAVGLAIGAAIAGAFRSFDLENEWVGEYSDSVKEDLNKRAGAVSQSVREAADTLKTDIIDAGAATIEKVKRTGMDAAEAAGQKVKTP